jgi:hypothetical protein
MRIRSVKPEFWKHPVYGKLDADCKWLAIALLSMADDEGYFYCSTEIIRAEVDPFRESLANLSRSLEKLRMIGWYEQFEHPEMGLIGKIAKWEEHQRVDHPKSSKIKKYCLSRNSREDFAKLSETLALDQGTGNREQGTRESDKFLHLKTFKQAYPPKGIESPNVEKNFLRLISEGVDAQLIISEATAYADYWKRKCGVSYPHGPEAQYIAQAENWLHKREYANGWSEKLKNEKPEFNAAKDWKFS